MSGFDWIIAAIFLVSMLVGIMRGFIREALSITSWIVALWLAVTYCEPAGDFIANYINIPADVFRTAAGFALIFIGTLFLFSIISFVIIKLLVKKAIKGTDRVLGIMFGMVRAAAIVVAVLLVARGMGMSEAGWWKNSQHIKHFEPIANYVEKLLPEQLQSSQKTPLETLSDAADAAQAVDSVIDSVREGQGQVEAPSADAPE